MKVYCAALLACFSAACTTTSDKGSEPETCAEVYSNDLSVTSKQHFYPIRFREVNDIRVDKKGWGVTKNSSGVIKLEPGKHRLEVFVVTKNSNMGQAPSVIDRQYVDVTVEKDMAYELLAFEKQGEEKTLARSKRFQIEASKAEQRVCEGGRIFGLPDESIFDEE